MRTPMRGAAQPVSADRRWHADQARPSSEAMEAPRFAKANAAGCDVSVEFRVPAATLQQLSERGHIIQIRREYVESMGRGQAILHDSRTGTNYAASDPRADGAAIPELIK